MPGYQKDIPWSARNICTASDEQRDGPSVNQPAMIAIKKLNRNGPVCNERWGQHFEQKPYRKVLRRLLHLDALIPASFT